MLPCDSMSRCPAWHMQCGTVNKLRFDLDRPATGAQSKIILHWDSFRTGCQLAGWCIT